MRQVDICGLNDCKLRMKPLSKQRLLFFSILNTKKKVIDFCTDGGTEYNKLAEFFEAEGIHHRHSFPYRHQNLGGLECQWETILGNNLRHGLC